MTIPKLKDSRRIIPGLALVLGVGMSILSTFLVHRWEASSRQQQFQRQIENLSTALQRSLNRYTDVLAFLGDYYQTKNAQVNRQEFADFVARSLQLYPGIQALEWAPVVMREDRAAFERQIQSEGFPNFHITEIDQGKIVRAGDRSFYVPVTYVEPFAGNEPAFGFDLNSSPSRAIAITQAWKTNEITATGRVRLVQEKRDQFGFLVFLPVVLSSQVVSSPPLLQVEGKSFLLGVFRVSDVVEESLEALQYEIDFSIYDQNGLSGEQFLGRYEASRQQVTTHEAEPSQIIGRSRSLCPSKTACTQYLTIGQRRWSVVFSPAASYPLEGQYGAIATLLCGLFLSFGLFLFLHRLNDELEQTHALSDMKFRFFSMASHELRTPLSTILLSSEVLQLNFEALSEEQKQNSIQRIQSTAKKMSQQITDLLMLTRAEVGKLEFNPELLDPHAFCETLVAELQTGITQPICFTNAGQHQKAFLDKKLLRSLLTNLLSNAAKYSPENSPIEFVLKCDDRTVTLEVRDRGIGIPEAERSKISEAFYRASNVGEISGTGLGLAIVKTCVEQHHGEWAIESRKNGGTVVTVRLPLE